MKKAPDPGIEPGSPGLVKPPGIEPGFSLILPRVRYRYATASMGMLPTTLIKR